MKHLFSLNQSIRRPLWNSNLSLLRGGKKKKGGAAAGPIRAEIVNIMKEGKEPEIAATNRYPPWLFELLNPRYDLDDLQLQVTRGERIPTVSEQWTLASNIRRINTRDLNIERREFEAYASDEDLGENFADVDKDIDRELNDAMEAAREDDEEVKE